MTAPTIPPEHVLRWKGMLAREESISLAVDAQRAADLRVVAQLQADRVGAPAETIDERNLLKLVLPSLGVIN